MIFVALTVISLLLGYGLTVLCSLAATFGIASASPSFVVEDYRIRRSYKRVYALIWLGCTAIGAFVAVSAASIGGISAWLIGAALTGVLIGMLWFNSWETRQRGIAHQVLLSLTTLIGVAAGGWLAAHLVKLQ